MANTNFNNSIGHPGGSGGTTTYSLKLGNSKGSMGSGGSGNTRGAAPPMPQMAIPKCAEEPHVKKSK